MSIRAITVASFFLITVYAAAQHPTKVRLKEKVDVPINSGGKSVLISVPPGTALNVRFVKGEALTLEYLGSLVEVESKKTDFNDQLAYRKAEEERKSKLITDTLLADARIKKEAEAKELKLKYLNIKESIANLKRNINLSNPNIRLIQMITS